MRHFLRIDGGVAIGPSLGAVTFVKTGDTLHLNEDEADEAKVAHDIAAASSGWLEVDEAGTAVPKRRTATPTVIAPDDSPIVEQLAQLHADDNPIDPNAQDPGGVEPPPQV
jgi:hypothetical protein